MSSYAVEALLPAPLGGRHSSAHATPRRAGRLVLRGPRCMCSRATTIAQAFAVAAGSPEAAPANPVEGMEVAAFGGCIAWTVNGVRSEAEVESRVLIVYFLWESLGAHQHRQGHPERGGTMRGPAGA
jgi:hypothetical protein